MTGADRARWLERVRNDRSAQGLAPTIDDARVLALLAALVAKWTGGRHAT